MSLPSAVEQAIKSCKAEQARINGSIQFYRDILHTVTSQPKIDSEQSDSADVAATETDSSPGEMEDIELLERALEKALRIRTGTEPSKKESSKQFLSQKNSGNSVVTPKERLQAWGTSKGNQTPTRSSSKFGSLDRKEPKTAKSSARGVNRPILTNCPGASAGVLHHQATRKSQHTISASRSLTADQLHASAVHSKRKITRSNMLSGNDLGNATAISSISSNSAAPVSNTGESGAHSLPRQKGIASDQTAKWKSLKRKQNRLWDKVAALQRKPVSGRSLFMERMIAKFPKDCPCGRQDQTRPLFDSLTDQGHSLTQSCQIKERRAKQSPDVATVPEWEAWDQWRPEGGCLCPHGTDSVCGDGMITPLPPTITYKAEAELRELEQLRMTVALLQQEIYLEQALIDALSPHLSSIGSGSTCPDVSVLRAVYSLLVEGGQHSPTVVLDSEAD